MERFKKSNEGSEVLGQSPSRLPAGRTVFTLLFSLQKQGPPRTKAQELPLFLGSWVPIHFRGGPLQSLLLTSPDTVYSHGRQISVVNSHWKDQPRIAVRWGAAMMCGLKDLGAGGLFVGGNVELVERSWDYGAVSGTESNFQGSGLLQSEGTLTVWLLLHKGFAQACCDIAS